MRAILPVLFLLATVLPAFGRDAGQYDSVDPGTRAWIKGLKNKGGQGCCDTADGFPAEAEWDMAAGGYRVRIEGEWIAVPDVAVLTEPNRLGYAVVWFYRMDGHPIIRCFLPGAGG